MASKLPGSRLPHSKLPLPGSKLRPPAAVAEPVFGLAMTDAAETSLKRRASDQDPSFSEIGPKRARFDSGSSDLSTMSIIEESSSVMGPPLAVSTLRKNPPLTRNKMRRSVSMANIAVNPTQKRPVPSSISRSNMSSSIRKLSSSNLNLSARPATRSAASTFAAARKPVSNITSKINNSRNTALGQRPNNSGPAPPPEKGRSSKRPAWDVKGRLQDMENVVQSMYKERDEYSSKLQDMAEQLSSLQHEKQHLNENLKETRNVKAANQEELEKCRDNLRDLEMSTKLTISRLENTVEQKDRNICDLKLELQLKVEETVTLKRTLSETTSTLNIAESRLTALQSQLSSYKEKNSELESKLRVAMEENTEIREKMLLGELQRRALHNKVLELKGNIRVFCRIRPLLESEIAANGGSDVIHHINILGEASLELLKDPSNFDPNSMSGLRSRGHGALEFAYDRVYGPKDSQEEVFEEVSQVVQSALDGYNVCVFAYGQTGSGKTYTMEGGGVQFEEKHWGIIPRTVRHIFQEIERLKELQWCFTLEASFLEIYNETIRDLLVSHVESRNLTYEIKTTGEATKTPLAYVTNLTIVPVEHPEQLEELLKAAREHRAVAATNLNQHSSRSHSVFRLLLRGKNSKSGATCDGTLSMVDLAGSERLKESGATGARLTETQNINRSLSNLSNVIMALAQKQAHVPYRNSKLTMLLQPSLGGNSKTLMMVNVSPSESCLNETLNSLRFATSVNNCRIGVATRVAKKT